MFKKYKIISLIIFSLVQFVVFSQENNNAQDTFQNVTYDSLINLINIESNRDKRLNYAKSFLNKAKANYNLEYVIGGYEILSAIENDSISNIYSDSIINISLKKPDNFNPANAYLSKARNYYRNLNYKESLKNYLLAKDYATKYQNEQIQYNATYGIGIIKLVIGDYESALKIHNENLKFFKKNITDFNVDDYINSLFSTSISLLALNKIDSANYYNKIGINYSKKFSRIDKLNLFKLSDGIIFSKNKFYKKSLDTINSVIPQLIKYDYKQNLSIAYNYLAFNHIMLKETDSAMIYLKKVDSLYDITKVVNLEARKSFSKLYEYSVNENDLKSQLYYLKKMISIDSTLHKQQEELGISIIKDFDIPKLVNARDNIINQLKTEKSNLKFYVLGLVLILVVTSSIFYIKSQKSKLKFDKLMVQIESKSSQNPEDKSLDIPKEIIVDILQQLEDFEKKNLFCKSSITLSSLSKEFNTNSSYLSKVINASKGKNFSRYLNELRIEYALEKLKNESFFRNYTITAISEEVGFKSAETFSKLFKDITGIYPSYYIKEIEKKMKK